MIGITIHFVSGFHTFVQETNRGHGNEKEFLSLNSTLKTKVFADEASAIKWILKFLSRNFNTVPFGPSQNWRSKPKEVKYFVDSCFDYIVDRELSLKDFVEILHDHWYEERTRDNEEFYNSKITLFDPNVSSDDSEDEN